MAGATDVPRYPHAVAIVRPAGAGGAGSQDEDSGAWVPAPSGADTPVWTGPADVQDDPKRLPRDAQGAALYDAQAEVLLGDPQAAGLVDVDDTITVTYPRTRLQAARTKDAQVVGTSEARGSIFVRFL